ncbi:hypothetical protein [Bacillus sp. ISL-35]|uniref:hypothetical protein n=1 Tax=Bacillus sp. ISL-35 TaxID=2819122 RepID=UPI001BE5047E|nr:hypothetical protein [Bacillus sp. ISL-35]MBT2705387.1 hypothetical protein [Chryseobacterium sp. ISL-80]
MKNNTLSIMVIVTKKGGIVSLSEPIALTKITVIQKDISNKIKQAYIDGFQEPLLFGVHGGVKQFYGVNPEVEYPSTLDHIVAAAGG